MKNLDLKDVYQWPITAQGILLCLLSVMLIYFGYLLDISLLQKENHSVYEQEKQLKKELRDIINKHAVMTNALSQIPTLKDTLASWQKRIITSAQIPDLQDRILEYGHDNHLHFNHYDPGVESKEGDYFKVPIKINMTGTFDQIASFISQVSNLQNLVAVRDFSIRKENPTDSSQPVTFSALTSDTPLTADLTIEVYRN